MLRAESHPTLGQDPSDPRDAGGSLDSVGDVLGDLCEACCPHCGFSGAEHKFDCADYINASLPGVLPSSALSLHG